MSVRLSRKLSFAGMVLLAIALWFLPDIVTWFNHQPDKAWARVQQTGAFIVRPKYGID